LWFADASGQIKAEDAGLARPLQADCPGSVLWRWQSKRGHRNQIPWPRWL